MLKKNIMKKLGIKSVADCRIENIEDAIEKIVEKLEKINKRLNKLENKNV